MHKTKHCCVILVLLQYSNVTKKGYSMFSLQQFVAFAAQLQCKVHATEEVDGLMLAHTEQGCVYSNGTETCSVEGEQAQGEVFRGEQLWGYYAVEGEELTLTFCNNCCSCATVSVLLFACNASACCACVSVSFCIVRTVCVALLNCSKTIITRFCCCASVFCTVTHCYI